MRTFVPVTDEIMREFIQYAVSAQQATDFLPKLSRLYLECKFFVLKPSFLQLILREFAI